MPHPAQLPDDPRRLPPLRGGTLPGGDGKVPSLTGLVERGRYKDVADLTLALRFGETFGYDELSSGGMAEIQTNLAQLPESDVQAIAEYLLSLKSEARSEAQPSEGTRELPERAGTPGGQSNPLGFPVEGR